MKNVGDESSIGTEDLIGHCSKSNGKKSMTVSDNTIVAEGLGDLFKYLGIKGLNVSKNDKNFFQKSWKSFRNRTKRLYRICVSKT